MRFKYKFIVFFVVWIFFVSFIFNKYAYEINQFNAAARVFMKHGSFDVRYFDEKGIPHSKNPKYEDGFISPFYVVHYGMIYSRGYSGQFNGAHWGYDKTLNLWNVYPNKIDNQFFKNSADWVVNNLKMYNGQYHLIYDFDWNYKGYKKGKLTAPWYSGLADSYAIMLMLRAYDVYGSKKYLVAAEKLYKSVLTPYEGGGSLTELNGKPWIEEYVQPGLNTNKMAFVLNGMIYSTYGVIAYERFMHEEKYSNILLDSIVHNLDSFGQSYWSQYDLIGNAANIKYHRIHVGLLEELMNIASMSINQKEKIKSIHDKWEFGQDMSGFFWVLSANLTFSWIHFFVEYFLLMFFPFITFIAKKFKYGK